MGKILGSFLICDPVCEPAPSEEELAKIKKARRSAVLNGNLLIFFVICVVIMAAIEFSCAVRGEFHPWMFAVSLVIWAAVIFSSACSAIQSLATWLNCNREARRDVIYPATMPPSVVELLENPQLREWSAKMATALLVFAVALAVVAFLLGLLTS